MKAFSVFFLAALCLSVPLHAQNYVGDAQLFPAETLAVVSLSIEEHRKQWSATPLAAILAEPEVRDFLQAVQKHLPWNQGEAYHALEKRFAGFFGVEFPRVVDLLQGCTLALVDLPQGSEPISLGIVVHFAAEGRAEAEQVLQRWVEALPFRKEESRHGEVTVHCIQGLENTLYYVKRSDSFWMATTSALMTQMIERSQTGSPDSLAQHPSYQQMRQALDHSSLFFGYLAIGELLKKIEWQIDEETHRELTIFAITDWESLGFSFSWGPNGCFTRGALQLSAYPRGVNVLVPHLEMTPQSFSYIPATSTAAVVTRISLTEVWNELFACAQAFDRSLAADLKKAEQAFLGFRLVDLAEQVGPSFALFLLGQDESLIPAWMAVAAVKDPAWVKRALETLVGLLQYRFQSTTYRGHTIYFLARDREAEERAYHERVALRLGEEERMILRSILGSLSFSCEERTLYVAPLPQILMDFFDARESGQPGLSLSKLLPDPEAKAVCLAAQCDLAALLPRYYQTMLSCLSPLEETWRYEESPFQTALVPRVTSLTRHLSPIRASVTQEGNLWVGTIRSNVGAEFYLPLAGLLVAVDESLGSPLSRFADESALFLDLREETKRLAEKQQFFEASSRWQEFFNRTTFEYFRRVAQNEGERLRALYRAGQEKLQQSLSTLFPSPHLGDWESQGDWLLQGDYLSVQTHRQQAWLLSTHQRLATYILEMEVQDLAGRLEVWCHCPASPAHRDGRGEAISFAENKALKGQWVPLQIKVKGPFISYWYGVQYHQARAARDQGYLGFFLPAQSSANIRRLRLSAVETPPKIESTSPAAPSLHIACADTLDPVSQGETTTYLVTLTNRGEGEARNVRLTALLSANLELVSPTESFVLSKVDETAPWTPLSLTPQEENRALAMVLEKIRPGEKIQVRLQAQALRPGGESLQLKLSFAELGSSEIAITEYTQVID